MKTPSQKREKEKTEVLNGRIAPNIQIITININVLES